MSPPIGMHQSTETVTKRVGCDTPTPRCLAPHPLSSARTKPVVRWRCSTCHRVTISSGRRSFTPATLNRTLQQAWRHALSVSMPRPRQTRLSQLSFRLMRYFLTFDLAFCLNHLLLKCLWTPSARTRFLACFDALVAAYRTGITWEPGDALEERAARLLPGLLLARVDGKSPVEYITTETDRNHVRRAARKLLTDPVDHLVA